MTATDGNITNKVDDGGRLRGRWWRIVICGGAAVEGAIDEDDDDWFEISAACGRIRGWRRLIFVIIGKKICKEWEMQCPQCCRLC